MSELKLILVEELLNALDDIQHDIPQILDYYINYDHNPDDNIHIDIDLLSMNIIALRDSAKLILNDTIPPTLNSKLTRGGREIGVEAEALHWADNPEQTGSFSKCDADDLYKQDSPSNWICNPGQTLQVNNINYKNIAFAMFLHIHMLTDPESIYNSGIICGNNWNTVTIEF